MARGKSTVLTDKQAKYVEGVLDGKPKKKAALDAGYSENSVKVVEKSRDVRQELAEARQELSSVTQIKRVDVLGMLQEAYDMSKTMAEPASMISAAREIGKMLGFYEPETVKVELTTSQASFQQKLMMLSDAELMNIIEGECTRVQ